MSSIGSKIHFATDNVTLYFRDVPTLPDIEGGTFPTSSSNSSGYQTYSANELVDLSPFDVTVQMSLDAEAVSINLFQTITITKPTSSALTGTFTFDGCCTKKAYAFGGRNGCDDMVLTIKGSGAPS